LQRQCLVFPAGKPDDGVDVLGLIGRGADAMGKARPSNVPKVRRAVTEYDMFGA